MKIKTISALLALILVAIGVFHVVTGYTPNTLLWLFTSFFGSLVNILLPNPDINDINWVWFSIGQLIQFFFNYFVLYALITVIAGRSPKRLVHSR